MIPSSRLASISRTIFILVLYFSSTSAEAQTDFKSFDEFNERKIKFFIKYLSVKPSTDKAYGGFTFNMSWFNNESDLWRPRFKWEQNLLSDAVASIVKKHVLGKPITKSGLDHAFSTGLFGSFQYGLNVVATDKWIVSPTVSFGDYIIAAERYEDTSTVNNIENNGRLYRDPAGYFFVAGPSIFVSYIPQDGFWIDAFLNYELTAYNVGERNFQNFVHIEGYPNPNFVTLGIEVNHRSQLFGGIRITKLVDRGSVKTGLTRFDLTAGINLGGSL